MDERPWPHHGHVTSCTESRHCPGSNQPQSHSTATVLASMMPQSHLHALVDDIASSIDITNADFAAGTHVCAHLCFWIVVCLGVWLAVIELISLHGPRKPEVVANARPILKALLAVVAPAQSVWPPQYASIAYRAAVLAAGKPVVHLPLSTLYDDIIHERVELRYPKEHLPLLFKDALSVSGVDIRLDTDYYWSLALRRRFSPTTPGRVSVSCPFFLTESLI